MSFFNLINLSISTSGKKCNGEFDCPLGEDEEFCLSLADENELNSLNSPTQRSSIKTYQHEGILIIRQNGVWAPLCLENSDTVSSLFGSASTTSAYSSVGRSVFNEDELTRPNNKLFKDLSADTRQSENGDLIVANSNIATLSAYSVSTHNRVQSHSTSSQQSKVTNYPRPWFGDETSFNFQLEELGRTVCSIQSFNELDSINVTNLVRTKQLRTDAGELKFYSMNPTNMLFKNSAKWGNLFKADTCISGKIASIRCKVFGKFFFFF